MKTITIPREIDLSDTTPGMTKLEVKLFTACELQKLTITDLTPYATKAGYEDNQCLADVLFEVNTAIDLFNVTLNKLKMEVDK